MDKKLPSVFANKITKKLENNENVYYSKGETTKEKTTPIKKSKVKEDINQKIGEIFSSVDFIYKADVEITYDNITVTKRIIGRNSKNIITYDNELIPIDKITDIRKL